MTRQLLLLGLTAQMLLALPSTKSLNGDQSIDGSVRYKEKLYFKVSLPANTQLKVQLTNLTADADIYTAQGRVPSIRDNDCYSSNSTTKDEECIVTIPNNPSIKSKEVTIMVYGFRTSDFTLKTTTEKAQYPEKLTLGNGVQKHINFNTSKDFEFKGKKNHTYEVTLDRLSADADLKVKVGKKATKHTFDCKSTQGGKSDESCTVKLTDDATIYMNVFGFREADYQITIKEQIKNAPITLAKLKQMIANGEDVTKVNTSKITDMGYLFKNRSEFNQDIGGWDVSNVTNMEGMFYDAYHFNQNIGSWNVSHVTNMSRMFGGRTDADFNQDISNWDVSHVTDMSNMFLNQREFNQPIGKWDVSNVTDMSYMFLIATKFNQPIGEWNVSNVTDMTSMFDVPFSCLPFNQDVVSQWNVSSVKNHVDAFNTCDKITEPKWKN